jgi:CubicO group peptidase (beta-lactamase class C family)
MGGVSGNAGLFGTARDMAVVMQMVLNGGVYDGIRYLTPATVELFTRQQYPSAHNRRAMGFDRPLEDNDTRAFDKAYPAPGASQRSFGHTGFTGTIAWADPDFGLVYVLLCNRVTPSRNNPAFVESRVRYALQQAVYDAIGRFEIETSN